MCSCCLSVEPRRFRLLTQSKQNEAIINNRQTSDTDTTGLIEKSGLVLKDFNRDQGRTQPEMCAPTPSTFTQQSCTLTLTTNWLQNHHKESALCENEVFGNCTNRCMDLAQCTETVAPTGCDSLGKSE